MRFPPRRILKAEAGDGGQGLRSNRAAAPQAALRVVAGLGTLAQPGFKTCRDGVRFGRSFL